VTATKDEIAERVDALGNTHQGDDFVEAIRSFSDEIGPAAQPMLQQVLLERAADEEDFQDAVRRRFAEKGWTRRMLARLERVWRDDRASEVAAALLAGPDGEDALELEVGRLRAERGRAALVLDELSRHESPRVRIWVPGAAADILGDGGARLVLSMTRDRDTDVRDAAVQALVGLDDETARTIAPDLRRRLQAPSAEERVKAIWALAELGDTRSLATLQARAESAGDPAERRAAHAATLVLREDADAVSAGLRANDPEAVPAFAVAARMLATDETRAALRECADAAPDDVSRAACAAELERLPEEA
jgi:hypothetical protein